MKDLIIPHEILFSSIDTFFKWLSNRSLNALKKHDIILVGDLVRIRIEELMLIDNIGKASVNEITSIVLQHGLCLGVDIPWFPREKKLKNLIASYRNVEQESFE